MTGLQWRVGALLAFLWLALFMNWYWPWGLLFLYWTVFSILSGETALVDTIRRGEHPGLFWAIIVTWTVIGVLLVLFDLTPELVAQFYAFIWGQK